MECGKQIYTTRNDANKVMRDIQKRTKKGPKRSYYCDACKGWHLSSRDINPKRSK